MSHLYCCHFPQLLLNSVSTGLSSSRSSLPLLPPPPRAPLPLCQRVIQVQFTGGFVKVNLPSCVRVGEFPLCSISDSLNVLSNTDPLVFLAIFFLVLYQRTKFGISHCLWLCNAACLKAQAKDWIMRLLEWLWSNSSGCHVAALQPLFWGWICIWNLTPWLPLLSLAAGRGARAAGAAQAGFLSHPPSGIPALVAAQSGALCTLCSALEKRGVFSVPNSPPFPSARCTSESVWRAHVTCLSCFHALCVLCSLFLCAVGCAEFAPFCFRTIAASSALHRQSCVFPFLARKDPLTQLPQSCAWLHLGVCSNIILL